VIHPDFGVPLTDRLGVEFEVGDTVLVPVRKHDGLGGARLAKARVREIQILTIKPGHWISTGPDSKTPFVRATQVGHKRAPEFHPPSIDGEGYSGPVDQSKCSVVSVEYENTMTGSCRYNDFVKVHDA
jgi:hypothetical protein